MIRAVTVTLTFGLAVVGCSSSSVDADAAAAAATCDALRSVDNRIVDIVNTSVSGIGSRTPDERLSPMQDGLDAVRDELEAWVEQIDELELGDVDEAAMLRVQLRDGAVDALAEVDSQEAEFEAADRTIGDDQVAGAVGTWFNAVEKVMSSIEPEVFRFERRDWKQAFLDEPNCRNVIQPFVND